MTTECPVRTMPGLSFHEIAARLSAAIDAYDESSLARERARSLLVAAQEMSYSSLLTRPVCYCEDCEMARSRTARAAARMEALEQKVRTQ